MKFTEKNIEQIKHELMTFISRFTSDVTAISIEPNKTFDGTEYLDITTNNIRMIPCVFQSLYIQGEAKEYKDEHDNECLWVRLLWCWKSFSGGSNGTELATLRMRKGLSGYVISEIILN